MKKRLPALIAAFFITIFIVAAIGAVSVNALFNPNSVAVSNAPGAAPSAPTSSGLDQSQVQQLQARINEYQQREGQYQAQLQNAQQQLGQANLQIQQAGQQLQQYQQFLLAMQRSNLIQIQPDGTIVMAEHDSDDD